MKRSMMAATLGLLALGGCQKHADAPAAPTAEAGGTLVVTDARLVLPAVKGNPGAFYFTAAIPGKAATRLAGITIAGTGKAELHETVGSEMKPLDGVDFEPGQVVRFEPGGRHAMVFGIQPYVKAGSDLTVTFHLANGTASTQAKVEAAGEAMGAMPAMGMGAKDMSHMDMGHGK